MPRRRRLADGRIWRVELGDEHPAGEAPTVAARRTGREQPAAAGDTTGQRRHEGQPRRRPHAAGGCPGYRGSGAKLAGLSRDGRGRGSPRSARSSTAHSVSRSRVLAPGVVAWATNDSQRPVGSTLPDEGTKAAGRSTSSAAAAGRVGRPRCRSQVDEEEPAPHRAALQTRAATRRSASGAR